MRLYFLELEPLAVWSGLGLALLAPKCILPHFYPPHVHVGPLYVLPLPTPLCATRHFLACPPRPCVSTPPTLLGDCGFFKSLVVGLPYSSIFWQFWVFFVLRLVVILLMVVQGGEVCLPTPPS